MSSYRIAIIPGDGVGNEVASEAAKILKAVADKHTFNVKTKNFDWGCDYYLKNGIMMPPNVLEILQEFDAIFLGCIGDANKVPDQISLSLLLTIRRGFDQYINLRPIKLYPGVESPIKTATPETVDMVVIRENTEGEYSGAGGFFKQGSPDALAIQTSIFTQKGCERAIRYAFELARKRKKFGNKAPVGMVTNCTKSNALNYSMVFWDSVYQKVAKEYPNIKTDMALVDALTMWFVKNPGYFDVIVASNLFGDIITDLGPCSREGWGLQPVGTSIQEKSIPRCLNPFMARPLSMPGKPLSIPLHRLSPFE